jgi:hypothetical protein
LLSLTPKDRKEYLAQQVRLEQQEQTERRVQLVRVKQAPQELLVLLETLEQQVQVLLV